MSWKLYIDGTLVLDQSRAGGLVEIPIGFSAVELRRFNRTYDAPAEVEFVLWGEWRPAPWSEVQVELYHGATRVFEGLTELPRLIFDEAENTRGLLYTAFDRRYLMQHVGAKTTPTVPPGFPAAEREPSISLPAGPLSTAVDALLAHVEADLVEKGIDDTVIYVGGAEIIPTRGAVINEGDVDQAFMRLAAAAPGVRVFLDTSQTTPTYTFVNLFGTTTHDVYCDEKRVAALPIQQTTKGCGGAVKIYGGSTRGVGDFEFPNSGTLLPAWNEALEQHWSITRAGMTQPNGDLQDELSKVFRLWSYAHLEDGSAGTPVVVNVNGPLAVKVQKFSDPAYDPSNIAYEERINIASIDVENKTILLTDPAISIGTISAPRVNTFSKAWTKGKATRANNVAILWTDAGSSQVNITIAPVRWPETGFAGRAVALSPMKCSVEKDIVVPAGVNRTDYARLAFAAYSEPVVSGDLPMDECPPVELMMLKKRVNLRTRNHGTTAFDNMAAPIFGISVNFMPQITGEIQFSRDLSMMLSGGQG